MPKSKNIADYFEAKLADLRAGEVVPFDIFLYFPQNLHLLTWKRADDLVTDGFIDKYRARGLERFWIHKSDADRFRQYIDPPAPVAPSAAETAAAEAEPKFRTEEGQNIVEILNAPPEELAEREKVALAAKEARTALAQLAAANTLKEQAAATQKARDVVADVLDQVMNESHSVAREIWKLAHIDPDLEHAVNVSTFAVIFAMAFGRIDKELIADIAMAGLLHDVGLSQVPAHLVSATWKSMRAPELRMYAEHVPAALNLIQSFAPLIPERVKKIVFQHHEKFDGSGYPQRLQGFKMDDVAQLLAIADLLDSIMTGQWDSKERTLMETFVALEGVEKARTFPEYFNPEVFTAVLRWIRNYSAQKNSGEAIAVVEKQVHQLVSETKF